MQLTLRNRLVVALAFLGLTTLTPHATAQEGDRPPARTLLAFSFDDPSEMFAHSKDAGLARVVAMLPDRIEEIVHVLATGEEAAMLRPLLDALGRPMRMAVTAGAPAEDGGPPSFGVVFISSQPGEEAASRLVDAMMGLFGESPLALGPASETGDGFVEMPTPVGPLRAGVRGGGDRVGAVLSLGDSVDLRSAFATLPELERGTTVWRGMFDLGAVAPILAPMLEGAAQEMDVAELGVFIERLQVILSEEHAPRWTGATSRTNDGFVYDGRIYGVGAYSGDWGFPRGEGLSVDDLRVVPAGASYASVGHIDLVALWDAIVAPLLEIPDAAEGLAEVEGLIGLSIRGDALPALGNVFATYTSMGGANSSTPTFFTAACAVEDRTTVVTLLGQMAEALNNAALPLQDEMMGLAAVQMRQREEDGASWFSIEAIGLPIPISVNFVVTDDWLVVALTPTSAQAAVRQASGGGDAGLGSHAAVSAALGGDPAVSVKWVNSPAMAPQSYWIADLALGAVAMGVQSPAAPERNSGVVMPTYEDWNSGVSPMVSVMVWDGDDLAQRATMDGSMLVNLATTIQASWPLMLVGMQSGILAPALERARDNALSLNDATQMQAVLFACLDWAVDHDGALPEDLDQLVDADMIDAGLLVSPIGPSMDGGPDYFLKPGARDTLDAGELMIYSRAAILAGHENIAVGFADTHVTLMPVWELLEIMSMPPNDTVQWDVPGWQ